MRMDESSVSSGGLYLEPALDDHYAGIRALWIKVIIRAIYDWVTYRDSLEIESFNLAKHAEIWLFERSELFNSFSNVCYYVGLNTERVRDRIRSMSRADVSKIEYLERHHDNDNLDPLSPGLQMLKAASVSEEDDN